MPRKRGLPTPYAIDLPCEIWLSIASFLSWVEVQNLFPLNSSFLNHYLRTKYATVHLGEFPNPQVFLSLKRLKEPSLCLYVQNLTLRPAALSRLPLKIQPSYLGPTSPGKKQPHNTKKKLEPGLVVSNQEITDNDLVEIVSNFTRVTTFTIEYSEDEARESGWHPHFPDLLRSGWTAFGSTLKTLVLNFPMVVDGASESLPDAPWAFPSEALPRLERVVLQLSCSSTSLTEAHAIGMLDSTIIAFLNCNNHIKHLVLGVFGGGAFDSSILLDRIGPFPSLTTLHFSHALSPVGAGIASGIHRFIMTKVPKLQELSLELDRTVQMAGVFSLQEKQRYNIRLSKLRLCLVSVLSRIRCVRIPPLVSDDFFKQLSAYINSMATSLTELDVNGVVLDFTKFKDVVRLFEFPTNVLTALHLPIDELRPQVFVFISHALPRLQRFTARYRRVDGRSQLNPSASDFYDAPQPPFIKAMQIQVFAHWSLEHLHIVALRAGPWQRYTRAIADAFPNVKTFNGTSRENYVSWSNGRHI